MSFATERSYSAVSGHFDEMALPSGGLRPHWRDLMASLEDLGDVELGRRWQEGQRLIRENGVTYNVYGDPRGMDRPWQLDAIPMLISSAEWSELEAAVAQRAALLDRMLADFYGEGRLIREGRLPPELVFANPGFLRACHGIRVAGDCRLHVYACDLARSPDGQWWVIADRAQAPSGAGYALENRVVMARILPDLFRSFHVRRLSGYFQACRDTLIELAPSRRSNPRMVLLTPGPYNETYFEHAYLSRYLGMTLVEGADLTVRDERVFLKTLSGLLEVDVILRRQDDRFCDPLELMGESALGVPGLVQAVRAGHVAVANALGTGLVETAATMAFLPGMCRHLLGEELRVPSIATWWCGHEREREYVIEHLHELVVKPTFPAPRSEVVFGQDLSRSEREALAERIRAAPHRFVAQEQVALSTVPTGADAGPSPRHLVLRVYAVRSGDGYVVMPGGLTRVSGSSDSLVVSSARGGGSKDTWVLADAPTPHRSLMDHVGRPIDVSRTSFALTSRVADNLLWLGRAAERAEAGARAFRCALRGISEEPIRMAGAPEPDGVELVLALGYGKRPEADDEATEPETSESRMLRALFDRKDPDSAGSAVGQLYRLGWLLRDRMSVDAWRTLASLDQHFVLPEGHPALRVSEARRLMGRAIVTLSAFSGIVMESMTRGLGWQFLDVGRRIERAIQVVKLLDAGLVRPAPDEPRRLENVLEIADSAMTYRSRYLTSVQLPLLLDLLLLDEANPRSVGFQLVELEERLAALPRAPREVVKQLRERVAGAELEGLAAVHDVDGAPTRVALGELLDEIGRAMPTIADGLSHAYLTHAIPFRRPATGGAAS